MIQVYPDPYQDHQGLSTVEVYKDSGEIFVMINSRLSGMLNVRPIGRFGYIPDIGGTIVSEPIDAGTVAVSATANALPQIRLLLSRLNFSAAEQGDNRNTSLAIMDSILAAETEEELFERQEAGLISSKDYTLRPFRLLPEAITWKPSAQGFIDQGGFPFYAILRVTDMETGDTVAVDSSAPSVISVLDKMLQWDDEGRPLAQRAFERFRADGGRPLQFVAKQVASGFSVVMLKPVITEAPKTARSTRGRAA